MSKHTNLTENIILKSDSYKFSHFKQYPKGTTEVYSYLESRGGAFDKTLFFGLQYIIKKHLLGVVVTKEGIDQAEEVILQHMGPGNFNREGWGLILTKHGGRLPIEIKAIPEGTLVDGKNVLMTVRNTHPDCYWWTNFLETILTQIWAPITVASQSLAFKTIIRNSLVKTGGKEALAGLPFKLHDFGYRGGSSNETAAISGAAHLLNFAGTDTMAAIALLGDYYGYEAMPGFSIPASEHSTITSWGKERETDAMENMLDQYPTGLVACVSDSFDIFKACADIWGDKLKEKILARDGTLVVRPDSGDPSEIVVQCLDILTDKFGSTKTSQGYKLLPPQIRLIQGDGIDLKETAKILEKVEAAGYASDNLAFGSGGALLQKVNRDTLKFAFKCSSITIDGQSQDVYKEPITASFKKSKRGKFKLVKEDGVYKTVGQTAAGTDELRTVFLDGKLMVDESFETIKARNT